MHANLSKRAAEFAHLTDLIRTSRSLADAAIPLLNKQLHGLAEMGIDNLELVGPRISSRTAGWSLALRPTVGSGGRSKRLEGRELLIAAIRRMQAPVLLCADSSMLLMKEEPHANVDRHPRSPRPSG